MKLDSNFYEQVLRIDKYYDYQTRTFVYGSFTVSEIIIEEDRFVKVAEDEAEASSNVR